MLKILKKLVYAATLGIALAATPMLGHAVAGAAAAESGAGLGCYGQTYNPMSDTDWNNLYPITIMGVKAGPNTDPILMYEPPVCYCPGAFGYPVPGIGVTFWQPLYIAEIERTPGCLSSLGGSSVLSGYATLQSEQVNEQKDGGPVSRMQIHWYEYPVFAVMDIFKSVACYGGSGVDILYLTEIDTTWQDDEWGAIFNPEAVLFTSVLAQAVCAIDTVAAAFDFPLDILFWCAGHWGGVYPLTGNASSTNSNFQSNNLVLAKFLARQARLGLHFATIGPGAICSPHPMPIWIKSQYRYNQVAPIPRYGKPVVTGAQGITQFPTVTNTPTRESTVNLIWQGQQCCLRY